MRAACVLTSWAHYREITEPLCLGTRLPTSMTPTYRHQGPLLEMPVRNMAPASQRTCESAFSRLSPLEGRIPSTTGPCRRCVLQAGTSAKHAEIIVQGFFSRTTVVSCICHGRTFFPCLVLYHEVLRSGTVSPWGWLGPWNSNLCDEPTHARLSITAQLDDELAGQVDLSLEWIGVLENRRFGEYGTASERRSYFVVDGWILTPITHILLISLS
ncbi:hypothetical protein EDB81DRAFT_499708 [Dactylonectria macrodidyma]|uniref:Uncharacterized protein n=1 Tax=Dactylonectria macrodidyma TaxID=307937 RepID=A0A9P9ENP0_9HYPO|nr:hypothetical protein EDB81DRAFT_499708 [Dactylonectria macrodidyma]